MKDTDVQENEFLKLECHLNKLDEKVKWYKNGELIDPELDNNIKIEHDGKIHRLIVLSARVADSAKFSAKASGTSTYCHVSVDGEIISLICR